MEQNRPPGGMASTSRQSAAPRANLDDGAVTEGYQADREAEIAMLNERAGHRTAVRAALQAPLLHRQRPEQRPIKAEFLEHAQQEQDHADRIAERIVQLNGSPNFNPATLTAAQPCRVRRFGRHRRPWCAPT
jgi:bacterioferritin